MKEVEVRLATNSYNIRIGSNLLLQTGRWLKESGFADKLVIITNPVVRKLYGDTLEQNLAKEGFRVTVLLVPDGEQHKSLEVADRLYTELTSCYAERMTPVIALGGGVIGDLAGFVAATYLRGLPFVQIPTTLLAQVDSSIGGKAAVNLGQVKNIVGAFYQPKLVISDIGVLKTLPAKEFTNGLAEVIKYGIACDKELFTFIEQNLEKIKALDEQVLEEIVFRSARIKAGFVEKDERDLGLRAVLNYGHTVGHAIESASDFRVRHGEAVAVGMLAAARISHQLGILDENAVTRLRNVMERAGLPVKMPNIELGRMVQAITHDKKVLSGKIRFVFPKLIGETLITEVSPSLIEQVLVDLV